MAGSSEPPRPRLALVALGCRVSRADLDQLAADVSGALDVARPGERADVVVVNTCSITSDAAAAARQALRRAARDHPGARIVASGCHAEVAAGELAALPGVAAVVGARARGSVAAVVAGLASSVRPPSPWPSPPAERGERGSSDAWGTAAAAPALRTRPFLKVQDGCDARCSYCVVPRARGPSRSLPFDEALRRIAVLGERHAEVVLTGVHLGAYGGDLSPSRSLADLLAAAARGSLARRLRLSSIEPDELPREVLADPAVRSVLCEHLHLPLQSGSARVLAAMRRTYGPERFREVVEDVHARLAGACLGSDVLVGFPGETDADHRATVALVESLPLAYLHVFPFSPREGTDAAALPDRVAPEVVRARARELLALSARRWRAFLAAQEGRVVEVVVERVDGGVARGTARARVAVRWPASGEARGDVARVRVVSIEGTHAAGVRA